MRLLALDLSLRSSGYAYGAAFGLLVPPKTADRGMTRLAWIRGQVLNLCEIARADVVLVEGYSFASHASHAHELGELGGAIRIALYDAGIPVCEIPPANLKMFITGKGNAKKDLVLVEVVRRLGYAGSSTDEADALVMLAMGRAHYNGLAGALTQVQQKALSKIAWPVIAKLEGAA